MVNRKDKIRELKRNLEEAYTELNRMLEEKKSSRDTINLRIVIEGLIKELNDTILNKHQSSFFEFLPTPPNRRHRRKRGKWLLKNNPWKKKK